MSFSPTAAAFRQPRFVLLAAILLCLIGVLALLDFPATEEPGITMRTATVQAYLPGEPADRVERMLARPIEEAIRAETEVRTVDTQVRPGSVLVYVTLRDQTGREETAATWQKLRGRLNDLRPDLPAATTGLRLDDDFGRVAVRTIAVTGKGYAPAQLALWAKHIRNRLLGVPGTAAVSLHGVRREIAYVDLNPDAVRAAGTSVAAVAKAFADRDGSAPTGQLLQGGTSIAVQAGDRFARASDLAAFPVAVAAGRTVPLGSLGTVRQVPQDPPQGGAFYNGKPAVVIGVAMQNGQNVLSFAEGIDARMAEVRASLPAGLHADTITDQAEVVEKQLKKVGQVFLETVAIVLGIVMLFLGWRSGLVTGVIVPMTVLGTALVMNLLGIELHQISIAAIIIALGIFVDNGIVVVEDYERQVGEGVAARPAAIAAGQSMLAPLLVSSLAIIIAFVPLVAGDTETAEYMRSLGIVLAITLLVSLVLALTVTPLLAARFIPAHRHHDEDGGFIGRLKRLYGKLVVRILARPLLFVGGIVALFAGAVLVLQFVPAQLLAPSPRHQVQIPIELAPSTSPEATMATAQAISRTLADRRLLPVVTSQIVYVADGGPRFILGLNPPAPALHRAYAVVNLDHDTDVDAAMARIDGVLKPRFPGVRFDTKRFSLGASETGVAVIRLTGPDRRELEADARRLAAGFEAIDGMAWVRTNIEAPQLRLTVNVDQARVAAAGLSNAAVFEALNAVQDGTVAGAIRDGDVAIPVVVRGARVDRATIDRLGTLPVGPAGSGITLASVATIRLADQPSLLVRRDLMPMVEVTARHRDLTAQALVNRMRPVIDGLDLPAGTSLAYGGEIEEGAKANAGLVTYAPFALLAMLLLFVWQFGSVRKGLIVIASMPFVLIGATLGLAITGQPLSFSATIGILALAGIIVNNAVLLLGRIAEDRDAGMPLDTAIAHAAEMRLRPIVMTKLVCIAGLAPLYLFGGDLWRPMAAAMMGGLALGTLITLVLIPALYFVAFRRKGDDRPTTTPMGDVQ